MGRQLDQCPQGGACALNFGIYFPGCSRECEKHPEREAAIKEAAAKAEEEERNRQLADEAFERKQTRALQASGGVRGRTVPDERELQSWTMYGIPED